jgi:hypothetical protein
MAVSGQGRVYLRVGHKDDALVATSTTHMSKSNTRVASCSLNDRPARFEQSTFFSVLDDKQSSSVFDAAAWVHKLCLGEDIAACLLRESGKPNLTR